MTAPPSRARPRRPLVMLAVAVALLVPLSVAWADTVTVYAAASTIDAMSEAARRFEKETGHHIRLSAAASSALARQIENGAPADIYLSANVRWMDYLAARDLIEPSSRRDLLRNHLVLIVPSRPGSADKPSSAVSVVDASFPLGTVIGTDRLAVADPDHVPAGLYARQALEAIGAWPDVASRLARAQNVRAALMLVARGEVSAGIVYRSDATATERVRIVGKFADTSHDAIVYPIAIVKGRGSPAVKAFLSHLFNAASGSVFHRHGFELPGE